MYKGFFALILLTLLIVAHCVHLWRGRGEQKAPWRRGVKVLLTLLAVLYVCAVAAGVAVVIRGADAVISHAAGVTALVLALWFDYRLGRACGERVNLEDKLYE